MATAAQSEDDRWFENNSTATGPSFSTVHAIGDPGGGRKIVAYDIDGDGDVDLVATAAAVASTGGSAGKFRWYENDGGTSAALYFSANDIGSADNPTTSTRRRRRRRLRRRARADAGLDEITYFRTSGVGLQRVQLDNTASSAGSVHAIDADGDGDTDALVALWGDTVAWRSNGEELVGALIVSTLAEGACCVRGRRRRRRDGCPRGVRGRRRSGGTRTTGPRAS